MGAAIPVAVGLGLAITGVTGTLGAGGFMARSMYKQRKANYRYLPRANFCFAQANAKQFDASKERQKVLAGKFRDSKKILGGMEPVREVYTNPLENVTQELKNSAPEMATEGQSTSGRQQSSSQQLPSTSQGFINPGFDSASDRQSSSSRLQDLKSPSVTLKNLKGKGKGKGKRSKEKANEKTVTTRL